MRFLRLPQVVAKVGLCPMTLWRRERQNPPTFPRRIKLGPNSVGWLAEEIDEWIEDRVAARDAQQGQQSVTRPGREAIDVKRTIG